MSHTESDNARLALNTLRGALRRVIECCALRLYESAAIEDKVKLAAYMEAASLELRVVAGRLHEYWPPNNEQTISGVLARVDEAFSGKIVDYVLVDVSAVIICFCGQYADELDSQLHGLDQLIFRRIASGFSTHAQVCIHEVEFQKQWQRIPPVRIPSELPAKPEGWRHDKDVKRFWGSNLSELLSSKDNIRSFLEFVYADIEVCAMEVCAHSILSGAEMPVEFVCDLARQIGDEARHAVAIREMYEHVGGDAGSPVYSGIVLSRYFSGESLQERLTIQHVIQESNSVEVNEHLVFALRSTEFAAWASEFETINRDEALHARIGNRWVRHILSQTDHDVDAGYCALVSRASERVKLPAYGKGAWSDTIRRSLDFPEVFIRARADEVG